MSVIKISHRFEGANDETVLYALFDSGATFSCLNPEYALLLDEPSKLRHP